MDLMKTLGNKVILDTPQEIIHPQHSALVIWDVQNALVSSIFNPDQFLENLKGFVDAAHKKQVPVIYVKANVEPFFYRSSWNIYKNMKRFGVDDPAKLPVHRPDSSHYEIPAAIAPGEGDVVINRPAVGIFFGTDFQQWMRIRGVQTIMIAGISTEQGVENTARDAGRCGFYPVVISDCVSSQDQSLHEIALKVMSKIFIVMSSKEIIKTWE
jgi:nicotinamidase-related amidase